jgi:hypothetical protein
VWGVGEGGRITSKSLAHKTKPSACEILLREYIQHKDKREKETNSAHANSMPLSGVAFIIFTSLLSALLKNREYSVFKLEENNTKDNLEFRDK